MCASSHFDELFNAMKYSMLKTHFFGLPFVNCPMSISNPYQDDFIRLYVSTHFAALRSKQKQNRDISPLTDDIYFLVKFVNESVKEPIPALRSMGIIILNGAMCFNLEKLCQLIYFSQTKIQTCFQRDCWYQGILEHCERLVQLIGEAESKKWKIYELPPPDKSEITRYILQNMRLIATETSIKDEYKPKLAAQRMDKNFPLVSIQYEREHASFSIFDYHPVTVKNFKIEKTQDFFAREDYKN